MKIGVLFAISGISLLGCSKSNIAVKYNNMIVEQQNKLKAGMDEMEPKLKNDFATFEYDSIASVSARMEAKIDSIIQKIKNEPVPKVEQGENFKKMALSYFDYFKSIYSTYKSYGTQSEADGRMYAAQDISTILSQENKMIADMVKAQEIFAKSNHFKIRGVKQHNSSNNSLVKK